jgi:DNA topoisomerase I
MPRNPARSAFPDDPAQAVRAASRRCVSGVRALAGKLRNTPAVCRRCYIHPLVIDSYLDGRLHACFAGKRPGGKQPGVPRSLRRLSDDELAVLGLLEEQRAEAKVA